MNNLYVFGKGGTGERVLKTPTFLLGTGIKIIGGILGLVFANVLVCFIFSIVASAILTWFGNATKY